MAAQTGSPSDRLSGRVALVTGAGAGIGAAVARRLGAEGAAVAVLDRDGDAAVKVAQEIAGAGGSAAGIACDVADRAQVREAVTRAAQLGEGVHIVVNNAGIIRPAMFAKLDEEKFRAVLDVHLMGTYQVSQEALPHLPDDGRGRIINSTSAAGLIGTIGQANYAAAKGAIVAFTKSLARELARNRITANVIAPLAATAMTETVRTDPRFAEKQLERVPLGRWAEPNEIAGAFAFMASDDASYITGQVLCVDGGLVMGG
jgi:3-oxoacyl-[acyl-carrier protein] reductase